MSSVNQLRGGRSSREWKALERLLSVLSTGLAAGAPRKAFAAFVTLLSLVLPTGAARKAVAVIVLLLSLTLVAGSARADLSRRPLEYWHAPVQLSVCRIGPVTGGNHARYGVPGDLIREEICDSYNERWDSAYQTYRYEHILTQPLPLAPGAIYWMSVQAVLDFPPQWGSMECDAVYYWNDQLVIRSVYFGWPDWTQSTAAVGVRSELSFLIHGQGGVEWSQYPEVGGGLWSSQLDPSWTSECADDFLSIDGESITKVEWWGGYFGGDPVEPDRFYVRFYEGTDTAVEPGSWGSIKAMFR